eukprot:TRINITY_DN30573_c0_g2_i1.p1 TRINITY_DN30573_c0_g2~~TRINITY_DN30573_c0_g2_i1.p1  ORF type:complete len:211 (+),score=27.93 TRINITY_DN30573_c0_g2_i1:64-696(+)
MSVVSKAMARDDEDTNVHDPDRRPGLSLGCMCAAFPVLTLIAGGLLSFYVHRRHAELDTCEGHWPPVQDCVGPKAAKPSACPKSVDPWPEKQALLSKLDQIETLARETSVSNLHFEWNRCRPGEQLPIWFVEHKRYRGIAWSRIEQGAMVGSDEFEAGEACWPGGYASHYVDKWNVRPSRRFETYVMEFDLEAFQKAAEILKACAETQEF